MNRKQIIESPLSSIQISKYFDGRPNIVTLQETNNYTDFEQLFKGQDHCVLFTSTVNKDVGHWQLYKKVGDILYFFDSYGYKPPEMLRLVQQQGNSFGQTDNLFKLLGESSYYKNKKVYYNNVQYQAKQGDVQTCGRYISLVFILFYIMKKEGKQFDFRVFKSMMDKGRQNYNTTYDSFVSMLIDDLEQRY